MALQDRTIFAILRHPSQAAFEGLLSWSKGCAPWSLFTSSTLPGAFNRQPVRTSERWGFFVVPAVRITVRKGQPGVRILALGLKKIPHNARIFLKTRIDDHDWFKAQ